MTVPATKAILFLTFLTIPILISSPCYVILMEIRQLRIALTKLFEKMVIHEKTYKVSFYLIEYSTGVGYELNTKVFE